MDETQKVLCNIVNQIFAIEQKVQPEPSYRSLSRRFDRIKDQLKILDLHVLDPINENYDSSRIDCDASITGEGTNEMKIVEVIKPIIFHGTSSSRRILQRGVVIVEGSK